jgi:glycosyltransferase involved in cell wall biosynthesis
VIGREEVLRASSSVSVVIPTHDRRDLAMSTIRSALDQRDVDVEIIVVDDASSDGTHEAVRSLSDPIVRLIRHDRRSGVAAARNTGIAAARAEWIALLDDDDLWAPHKVRSQLDAADAAGSDWVYGGVVEIDGDGRYLGGDPPPSPQTLVSAIAKRNLMPAGCSNVMIRSRLVRRAGGFEPRLRHLADWDLWLRLGKVGIPACASEPLVAYRVHRSQATLDTTGMIEEARVLEARHGADPVSIFRWLAWSHLRLGQRGPAARAYLGAVREGDTSSLLRAGAALLLPRPTRGDAVSRDERRWLAPAGTWLSTATGSGVGRPPPAGGST